MLESFMKNTLSSEAPDSIIKSIWNTNINGWSNEWRATYAYDESGLKKNEVVSNWQNEKWLVDHEIVFNYEDNYLIQQISYLWQDFDEFWIPQNRYLLTYDNFNNITQQLDFKWSQSQNSWVSYILTENGYNGSQKLLDTYKYLWSISLNDWENYTQTIYNYNLDNLAQETYSIWDFDYLVWDTRSKSQYTYDSINQMIEQTLMTKSSINTNLLNDSKIEYIYFGNGLIKNEIYWYWDENQNTWFEDYMISYTYDYDSKLIKKTLLYYDWAYLEWMNRYQTIYEYNSLDQHSADIYYHWNNNKWNENEKYKYYYQGYSSIKDAAEISALEIYPVPAKEKLFISYNKELSDKVQIEICDLNGIEVYSNQLNIISSKAEINLPLLASGIYIFKAINNNKIVTRKIIIDN